MSTILDSTEIEAIGKKEWRLNASQVSLRCPRWERTLRGTGSLEMDDGGLVLRFNSAPCELRQALESPPQGLIATDEWYYSGVLMDARGRRWQISRFLPNSAQVTFGSESVVLRGRPLWVRSRATKAAAPGHSGQLYFFPSLKFPPNVRTIYGEFREGWRLDAAKVEVNGLSLHFSNQDDGPGICRVVSVDTKLPQNWGGRICEALQFITARWHEWTISSEWRGPHETVVVSFPHTPEPSRILPPIDDGHPSAAWRMFSDYLRVVLDSTETRHHRMTSALRSVIRASAATVEARALQLGVSIDQLIQNEFGGVAPRVDESQLERAMKAVRLAGLDESVQRRIESAIRSISNPRPKETLKVLVDRGQIRKTVADNYGKLRHPAVHGATAEEDLQGWLDRSEIGLCLLYELVLAMIGYHGPYRDHSTRERPIIQYPPKSDAG